MNLVFKNFLLLKESEHRKLLEIRNDEIIRNNMKSNAVIGFENHLSWIKKLENDTSNIYYAVIKDNDIVGAIYITIINNSDKTCTWGLYFKKNINPLISSISTYLIIEKIFQEFHIKKLYSEVKKENIAAYKFNETLGFKKEKSVDKDFYKLSISADDWENNKNNGIITTVKKRLNKIEYKFA